MKNVEISINESDLYMIIKRLSKNKDIILFFSTQ